MARKRDDTVKLVLRLPPALHRRLTHKATRKNRSLNSEMVLRLERSLFEVDDVDDLGALALLPLKAGLKFLNEKLDRILARLDAAEKARGEKK